MRSIPFAVRVLVFAGIVVVLHLLVIAGLVLLGLFGLSITGFSVAAVVFVSVVLVVALIATVLLSAAGLFGPTPINFAMIAIGLLVTVIVVLIAVGVGLIPVGAGLFVISVAGVVAVGVLLIWFVVRVHKLPLPLLGLSGLTSIPAIPLRLVELPDTILRLLQRSNEIQPSKDGLTTNFTMRAGTADARTANGHAFMFGTGEEKSYSLDNPDHLRMAWTTLDNVGLRAAPLAAGFADTLLTAATGTREFWPTIAKYNLAFNLLPLERVTRARGNQFRSELGSDWTTRIEGLRRLRNLYAIDMSIFSTVAPPTTALPRFTPITLTLLEFIPATQTFEPILIRVSNGRQTAVYTPAPAGGSTWLYALQAAKVSITVWGIWIGHVHHFHIVTAAMQMTMFQYLPHLHPVRQLLGHQSDFLIGFDQFLLMDWAIGPPTSITSSDAFLRLIDAHARTASFFNDDPRRMLRLLRLNVDDFTTLPRGNPARRRWDRYPAARYLLRLYRITRRYVRRVVRATYPDDSSVAADVAVQQWLAASGDPIQGNVSGLPLVTTRAALVRVLTSLIYRITAHGASRMNPVANPGLTFIGNFPPCLEDSRLPDPSTPLTTRERLAFMPKTGSMGEMATFLYTFVYSPPYIPFIPTAGVRADLPYVGPAKTACDNALIAYRRRLRRFIRFYMADSNVQNAPAMMNFQATPQHIHQWELNIET